MKKRLLRLCVLIFAITGTLLLLACGRPIRQVVFLVGEEVHATVSVEEGDPLPAVEEPSLLGYRFDGWFLDPDTWELPLSDDALAPVAEDGPIFVYAKLVPLAAEPGKPPSSDQDTPSSPVPVEQEPDFLYEEASDAYLVVGRGSCTTPVVRIPSSHLGKPVIGIAEGAFRNQADITELWLPEGIISIESNAMAACTGLKHLQVPSGVTFLGVGALAGCTALETLTLPTLQFEGGVTFLGALFGAVDAVNQASTVPGSLRQVTVLGGAVPDFAFYGCHRLTCIQLGGAVGSLGNYALAECSALDRLLLPTALTSVGVGAFLRCVRLQRVLLPEGLQSLSAYAFSGCTALESVVLPEDVRSVGENAFLGCTRLVFVSVGENLEQIGANAFADCVRLVEVANGSLLPISSGSTAYGGIAARALRVYDPRRSSSALDTVTYPGFVFLTEEAGVRLISYTGEEPEVILPSNAYGLSYTIHDYAFYREPVRVLCLGDGVSEIGAHAMAECLGLTTVAFGAGIQTIGERAFFGCQNLSCVSTEALAAFCSADFCGPEANPLYYAGALTACGVPLTGTLTVPTTVARIGRYALCGLRGVETVVLPDGLAIVGEGAFVECTELRALQLPAGLQAVGDELFCGCVALQAIHYPAAQAVFASVLLSAFVRSTYGLPQSVVVYCTDGTLSL